MSGNGLLAGIRVLSLEQLNVLPLGTAFLSDFGAEVIRVENLDHLPDRKGSTFPDNKMGEEWWNEGAGFTAFNRNKESLCMDVTHPRGKEAFYQLVKNSHVVCDNFRPGSMKRWGLDYESLRQINPQIISLSCTGYGQTGPWRMAGARARTADTASGLTSLTGYEGGPAQRASSNYMDHAGGNQNAFALLLAIYRLKKEGKGSRIAVSMQETGTQSIAPAILEGQFGYVRPRLDTGHLWKAPHKVYPCEGQDRWIAITVSTNEEWVRLKKAMGDPAWAATSKYDTAYGRYQDRKTIDKHMAEWTKGWDFVALMHYLQDAGVPAGAAMTAVEMYDDPHLTEWGYFQIFNSKNQPHIGPRKFAGRSYHISGIPVSMDSSPDLGEHNTKVLKEIGGLSDREINDLYEIGVLADRPRPGEEPPTPTSTAFAG
jgi:crotonobetainyl-CoA:carnitine CoA-transferase CaiB-like acyl-CoA transferase